MSTQIKTKKAPRTKASDMFFLAAITFLLFLIEPVLLSFFNMYGFGMAIALRAICMVVWVFSAKGLINTAKKDCGWDVLKKEEKPSTLQWVLVSVITAAALAYLIWNKAALLEVNFKGLTSLKNIVAFSSLILLNLFKTIYVTLFLAFIQKGCEISFKAGKWIPVGGIVLGIVWAAMFIVANITLFGSSVGFNWFYALYQFAYGLLCGIIFVVSGNKARYAFPFIALVSLLIYMS